MNSKTELITNFMLTKIDWFRVKIKGHPVFIQKLGFYQGCKPNHGHSQSLDMNYSDTFSYLFCY